MNKILLFSDFDEFPIAAKYMRCGAFRSECKDSLAVGRYSVLPDYHIVEAEIKSHGGQLINSLEQHKWIADFTYYDVLKEFTAESWDETNFHSCDYDGPFVVKGATNSKKQQWNTKMFAPTKRKAVEIGCEIKTDSNIAYQRLIYRRYVPLRTFEIGVNDIRFTNEFRCFFLGRKLVAHGYYWSQAQDAETRVLSPEGFEFAQGVADIAAQYANFYTLDVAEQEGGGWILIEINDGQQAGLSMIDPDLFYSNLAAALAAW